jgi:O-antigen/teichoic acid export membrane protein
MNNLLKNIRYGINSTIGKNIIALYLLQISYYVLPLITIPYLVRVLGPEKFGLVAFGQSFITFFVLFINYGFDLTATREISIKRKSNEEVSRIACSVWIAKALLCSIGLSVLLIIIQLVPKMNQNSLLLLILYGIAVGNLLFPNWLFLGLERMKAISVINLTMRSVTTAGVFILIRNPDDYLIYAGILSFQWVLAGILGVVFAVRRLKIRLKVPNVQEIFYILSSGSALFLSNIAQSIYYSGNSFILGMLTNYSVVGYYSAAEKITLSLLGLFRPVALAVYPRFSQMASSSKNTVLFWSRRLIFVMGSMGLTASITLFFGAPLIVKIILGPGYEPSIIVLQVLSLLPFIVALSDVLSIQIMLPFSKDKFFTLIRVFTALLHVLIALLLVPKLKEAGMAAALVLSQAFILISTFLCLSYWKLSPLHYKIDENIPHSPLNSKT